MKQGEDVVAGIRTPQDLDVMKQCMPEAYKELVENCIILERHYKEMMVRFFISQISQSTCIYIYINECIKAYIYIHMC